MRFFDLSATAFATVALLQGAVAVPAEQPQGYGAQSSITSATTTYYTTLTVFRVETTVTATRNGSLTAYESTSTETSAAVASATIPSYGNSTTSVLGTGAYPSSTGVLASPGAASTLQIGSMAVATVAGLVGLLLI